MRRELWYIVFSLIRVYWVVPKGVVELLASSFYKASSAGVVTMRFGLFYGSPLPHVGSLAGEECLDFRGLTEAFVPQDSV